MAADDEGEEEEGNEGEAEDDGYAINAYEEDY